MYEVYVKAAQTWKCGHVWGYIEMIDSWQDALILQSSNRYMLDCCGWCVMMRKQHTQQSACSLWCCCAPTNRRDCGSAVGLWAAQLEHEHTAGTRSSCVQMTAHQLLLLHQHTSHPQVASERATRWLVRTVGLMCRKKKNTRRAHSEKRQNQLRRGIRVHIFWWVFGGSIIGACLPPQDPGVPTP